MAGSVNKATLIGNLGADPDIRALQDGRKVASFGLATSESWKDRQTGEKREQTEWHKVVVWGDGLVGVLERYVRKGSKLYVEGQLRTRKWQDQNGVDRTTTEVTVSGFGGKLVLLGDGKRGGAAGGNGGGNGGGNLDAEPRDYQPADDAFGDEIPF